MVTPLFIRVARIGWICVSELLHGLTLTHVLMPATESVYYLIAVAVINFITLAHHLGLRLAHRLAVWLERLNWLALAYLAYYIAFYDLEDGHRRSIEDALPVFIGVGLTFIMNVLIWNSLADMIREYRQDQKKEQESPKDEKEVTHKA